MTRPLPSGVSVADLGVQVDGQRLHLPAGLIGPADAGAAALVTSLGQGPRWWNEPRIERTNVAFVAAYGSLSLNGQVLPLLEAAEAAGAAGLVVLAPMVTHEALATLFANDRSPYFPAGLLPLQLLVNEYHMGELMDALGDRLGVPPWDGRPPTLSLLALDRIRADARATDLWLSPQPLRPSAPPSLLGRARRWLVGRR